MLNPGERIETAIEKPAAGGRMIARHDGQILLVSGAIPGERVAVRIERVEKRVAFASTVDVLNPSVDRRDPGFDPLCGGCLYAHVAYPRQVALKAEIIADAFARIGRLPIADPIQVASSPETGYRMRARFHAGGQIAGFYREQTHEICNPRHTHQLTDAAIDAVETAMSALGDHGVKVAALEFSENLAGDQRALHLDLTEERAVQDALTGVVTAAGLTGVTARGRFGPMVRAGSPTVGDSLASLTGNRAAAGELRRHPTSFFQANRFLLPQVVLAVVEAVPPGGDVLDLYAGVGLFSSALAALGHERITAVEGDRSSAADLQENAQTFAGAIRAVVGRVEDFVRSRRAAAGTIVVDPPRTGISKEAIDAIAAHGAARIIYVSCDPPTMARDARRLVDAGYALASLSGFDLFPNTPHVETLGVFDRA